MYFNDFFLRIRLIYPSLINNYLETISQTNRTNESELLIEEYSESIRLQLPLIETLSQSFQRLKDSLTSIVSVGILLIIE